MRKLLTASTAALALAGMTLGAAAPAEARYHGGRGYYGHGYYGHYHGGRTAAVLGAGILGLAAGAAIADRGYYGGGYAYAPAYYDYAPAYYAPPPPPVVYRYYGRPYYPYRGYHRW